MKDSPESRDRSKIAPVTFRDAALEARIAGRMRPGVAESMGLVAKRDLARLYDLVELELSAFELSADEACLICDALQGVITVDSRWRSIWAEIDDGIRARGLAPKWNVPESAAQALVQRVRDASPGVRLAICDAAERFWALMEGPTPPTPAAAVGLVGLSRTL